MITSGEFSPFKNSIYNVSLSINSPDSGFELRLLETGASSEGELVKFSGNRGYIFDQSGNFWGGYQSGVPFDLEIHYNYHDKTFSYYSDNILIANGLDVTGSTVVDDGKVGLVTFLKHGDSTASVSISGVKS
tara:strand:- start:889 stop:1284 length:396 start_codon:yes stop_codon:yes gene_type:complete